MKYKLKRTISLFLMMVMLMSSFTGVLAENINTIPKKDSDVTVDAPPETVPEATPEVTPSPRPEVSPSPSPEVSPETSPEITPEPSPEASPEISPNPSPEASAKPSPEVSPSPSSEPTTPTEEKTFTPLAIKDETKSIDAAIGDTVEFFVTLNRDDVNVRYQWQKNCTPPEEEKLYGTEKEVLSEDELANKEIFSSGGYQWLIDDVSEAEWLVDHPDIIWQGKDLWDKAVELAGGDTSKVHIPNGAKSIADVTIDGMTITSEGVVINNESKEEIAAAGWQDLEGETNANYLHIADENDQYTVYRCVVTIEDKVYFAEAAADANKNATTEEVEVAEPTVENLADEEQSTEELTIEEPTTDEPIVDDDTIIVDSALIATTVTSCEMRAKVPEKTTAVQTFNMLAKAFVAPRAAGPSVRRDGDYIVGLDKATMEYITKNAYDNFGCSGANNAYWTKLNGGTRPDGTSYSSTAISTDGQGKMPILSAWYGKTIYMRYAGSSGIGTAIDIPAYTGIDYQTGQKTVYKNAITVLSVRVPETSSVDFYTQYINTNQNRDSYILSGNSNGAAIFTITAPLTQNGATDANRKNYFNNDPDRYLKDAEGNYRIDSVMVGVCVDNGEPDLSGKAAWALKEYISEGYGLMTGHDMMYGYGGVTSSSYVPDRYSTRTPYYQYYSGVDGHWNMNWLMGVNKKYTDASPYEAASLILCSGNDFDKNLYGQGDGESSLVISKVVDKNPLTDVGSRVPTNYPYSTFWGGENIGIGREFRSKATHSCMQVAYGNIWVQFTENDFDDFGEIGKLIVDSKEGLTGTNNFYLTTNGNLAMNQVGHLETGHIYSEEAYIFANTVMYISQRKQCQVCQSEQNGNTTIHFVHDITNAAELAKLNDSKFWYTNPTRNCYMLTNDIQLPDDWTPIKNFDGHFNADGHTIKLGANGAPLFANDKGKLDEHKAGNTTGWNLGIDDKTGLNSIVDAKGNRTTGVARVSGYLASLFGTGFNTDWSNCRVEVFGTDGKTYNCVTNTDGKYVISNLPTTGIMKAKVYDRNGRDITEYGPVRANVSPGLWNTSETTPLYLVGFTAMPVADQVKYEGETANFLEGGVFWQSEVKNIKWQYTTNPTSGWRDLSSTNIFEYEVGAPKFTEAGDDSYTSTSLTIKKCRVDWSGYSFRAVFESDGRTADTYTVKTASKSGLLTVKPMPMYVTNPPLQEIWVDGTASFTSECEAVVGSDSGLKVQWQVKRWLTDTWMSVENYPDLIMSPTSVSITNKQTDDAKTNPLTPYKTTSTLSVKVASVGINGLYFRALYSYDNEFNQTRSKASDGAAQLSVKPPQAEVEWIAGQADQLGLSFTNPVIVPASKEYSTDVVKYEADIYYEPGPAETTNGSPTPEVRWQYLNHGMTGSVGQTTWNVATANALAIKLGINAPTITFSNSDPVKQPDGRYKITAKMEMTNLHWKLYSNDCFLEFSVGPILHYQTDPYKDFSTLSTQQGLFVDYKVGIKWNQGKETKNGDHTIWTYPDMTVNSVSGVKTMLLYFEGAVGTNFDARDKIAIKDNLIPPGMVIDVNSSKYLMFTVNGSAAVSDAVIQKYLRENISLVSYDTTKNPKIMAYINAETDFAAPVKARSGLVVNFSTDAKTPLEGETLFTSLQNGSVIDVPTPVADENYEFSHWEDEYGRELSFMDTISISKSRNYTAKFNPINDSNQNDIPDEFEALVTFKVENGMFMQYSQPHQEWNKLVTLYDENGNPSAQGQATLSPQDFPSVFADDGYLMGEWENTTITSATTLTNKCVKAVSKDVTEESGNIVVLFSGDNGLLEGQTQFVVPIGSTWKDANISMPVPKTVEKEKVDGKVEITSFVKWDKEIPSEDYVFTGKDGDVLSFIAEFKQEEEISEKTALENKQTTQRFAQDFADSVANQSFARSAQPRYAGVTLSITGNTGAGMTEGSSLSLAANGSAPYMQWEVYDKSGWSTCTAENYQTMIVSRLLANMEGWKYRLRYGNSAEDSKLSNEVTVAYVFNGVRVMGSSVLSLRGSSGYGNAVTYPTQYVGRVSSVSFAFIVNNGQFTNIGTYLTNDGGNKYGAYVDDLTGANQTYTHWYAETVNGGRNIFGRHWGGRYGSSGTLTIADIAISGVGGTGGSDSGLVIQRGIYEALDVTTIWHDKTVSQTANVVATVSANDKVYDGEESMANVTLTDSTGALTAAQLDDIKARGRLEYSNNKTTAGNATTGSGCIDAGAYKVTFVPLSGDAHYFASNSYNEISARTTTFKITPRPVSLYSYNNDRVYDGTDIATVKDVKLEAFNKEKGTGVVSKDTGRVALNVTTFVGNFNGIFHQTNGAQSPILRPYTVNLYFTGDKAANYKIVSETYTGAITSRPLSVHSLYQDIGDTTNNPRNVKVYDNTTSAVISKILVDNIVGSDTVWIDKTSYKGAYATENAGERLGADGKVLPDHLNKLTENVITRTDPISLVNNDFGDYVISTENYSGAIYRALAEYTVSKKSVIYGEEHNVNLKTAGTYTKTEFGNDTDLTFGPLLGTDKLKIDKNKSDFVFSQVIDKNTPAGVYKVTYKGLTEQNYSVLSNYVVMGMDGSIIVNPRPLTITVAGGYEKQYGEQLPKFGVTITGWADNGDTIANSLYGSLKFTTQCKWNSDVRYQSDGVTIVPYGISASGLFAQSNANGWQNYELIYVDGTIKVLPAKITIEALEKTKVYGYGDPHFDYLMSMARVKEDDLQFGLTRIKGENVGKYDILFDERKVTERDNGNYDINFISAELNITPRILIIDSHDYERYYGEDNPDFEVNYNGFANGDVKETALENTLKIKTYATKLSDIGNYNIGLSEEKVKKNVNGLYNYNIVYMDGSLNILPKPVTVIAEDKTKYIGEEDPALTWRLADGEAVADRPLKVELSRAPGEEAYGTYPIFTDERKLRENNPNYLVTFIPGNLTILKDSDTDLILKVGNATTIYGEKEPSDSYRLIWYMNENGKTDIREGVDVRDIQELKLSGELSFMADGENIRDVGVYDINGTGLESGKYKKVVIIPGDLEVNPRPVTLTPQDKVKMYGDTDPVLTYSLTDEITGITYQDGTDPAARVKEGDLNGTLGRRTGEKIGKYIINTGTLGEDNNYKITLERGFLTITPADLIISVYNPSSDDGEYTKSYGSPNPAFDIEINGFKNGDDIDDLDGKAVYRTDAEKMSAVGKYSVEVEGFSNKNYNIIYVPGTLNVVPLDTTIIVDSKTKEYGDKDPEFTWHLPDDSPFTADDITGTLDRTDGEDVDVYLITGEFTSKNPNMGKITVMPGVLTILPAKLLVKAEDKAKVYGDENPEWTSVVDGFKNGDTLKSFTGEIVYSVKEKDLTTDIGRTSDVGEYPINISEKSTLTNPNYEIEYADAELTITKRPIDIAPGDPNSNLKIEKFADKTSAMVGETINYKLVVTNTGNVELTNIPITDSNDGSGSITATGGQGYTYDGGNSFTILRIPVGQSVSIDYSYKVVETDVGKDIRNVAVAKLPGDPTNPDIPDKEIPSNEVVVPVDTIKGLLVTKSADKSRVTVGETISYTISVKNTGPEVLTNLSVDDGMTATGKITAADEAGYTYNGNGNFTIASLDPGATIAISYTYIALAEDAGKTLVNIAVVTIPAKPADPNNPTDPGTPEDKVPSNPVEIPVDNSNLKISKRADVAFVGVGETITYFVDVTNLGSVDCTNVLVKDNSDGAGSIIATSNERYTYNGDGTFTISSIGVGETVTIVYTYVAVEADAGKTITNVAIANDPANPDTEVPSKPVEVPVIDPNKGPITVIPDPYVKIYGDTDPELTYKISEPLVKPDDIWGNVERADGEDVGSYPIDRGTVESENYEINFIPGTFEIIPAPLVITALNADRYVGEENPLFSASYSGFKLNDGPDSLNGKLSITTTADKESPVGKYPIVPEGQSSKNYTITYVNGVLTVKDNSNVSIEKTADKTSVDVGETVTYTITLKNSGSRDAENLTITDTMQASGAIIANDGEGYEYLGNGVFKIEILKAGQSIEIIYTYVAQEADAGKVLENVAVVKVPGTSPEDPDKEIPSDPVEIPVEDIRGLSIRKSTNASKAKVGDRITYTLTVKNTGTVELDNAVVKDNSSGKGIIIAVSGKSYTYDGNNQWTIAKLPVGGTVYIVYDYIVADADAGTTVKNVAIATIPGTPEVPGDPDDPSNPGKPALPPIDVPSNEVTVPVAPLPGVPTNPSKPPIIVTPNPQTGIGFMSTGMTLLLVGILATLTTLVTVFIKRNRREK